MNGKFAKKLGELKETEQDLERERKGKKDVEKQLKDIKKHSEEVSVMLKTGEMSQDELRRRIAELAKKLKSTEEDLKKEMEENELMVKDLQNNEEQYQKNIQQMIKEASHYKETITKMEGRVKTVEIEKGVVQANNTKLQEEKFALEDELRSLNPILIHKDKVIEDLNVFVKQLKELAEQEKNEQREEYMRAFGKLKAEIAGLRTDLKTKEDELLQQKKKLELMQKNDELYYLKQ